MNLYSGLLKNVTDAPAPNTIKNISRSLVNLPLKNYYDTCPEWFVSLLHDPAVHSLYTAPYDDEPTSEKEDLESQKDWEEYMQGNSISNEDALKEIFCSLPDVIFCPVVRLHRAELPGATGQEGLSYPSINNYNRQGCFPILRGLIVCVFLGFWGVFERHNW